MIRRVIAILCLWLMCSIAYADDAPRTMLRALLADRFHLEIRMESKEMPMYEITVAKGGPKLTKSLADCDVSVAACHGFSGNPRRMTAEGVDMADLASMLTGRVDRPVHDKTGITGLFDFLLQWNVFYGRERPAPTKPANPRISPLATSKLIR